jgi:hypothetical protein
MATAEALAERQRQVAQHEAFAVVTAQRHCTGAKILDVLRRVADRAAHAEQAIRDFQALASRRAGQS